MNIEISEKLKKPTEVKVGNIIKSLVTNRYYLIVKMRYDDKFTYLDLRDDEFGTPQNSIEDVINGLIGNGDYVIFRNEDVKLLLPE